MTLVEATWPENILPMKPRVFPNDLAHAKSDCDCNGILQATSTAVDSKNGRLWVIDNGSKYCSPKVIIFDLLRRNNEVTARRHFNQFERENHLNNSSAQILRHVFTEFKGNSFKSIHLQHKIDNNDIIDGPFDGEISCNAFITVKNANFVIIYSQRDKVWHKLALRASGDIVPNQLTIRNNLELLISDASNNLWFGNLTRMRYEKRRGYFSIELNPLGQLLGKSASLAVSAASDEPLNDFLYYYMPRDGAVVRWDFR